MTKYLLVPHLLLLCLSLQAQTTYYYSRSFQTKETSKTAQKRIFTEIKDGFQFEDYQDKKLDQKGVVNGTHSVEQAEKYLWFLRSALDMHYEPGFDKLSASITDYRADGKRFEEITARGKNKFSGQIWNKKGEPVLVNGTGTLEELPEDNNRRYVGIYKDSVLASSYSIRIKENDTIYLKTDQIATPKEGYNAFIPSLAKAIGYPSLAQWAGKEGLVYITFIVDKQGNLTEIKPRTTEGFRMEGKAVKQLAKLPPWTPAYFQGKPVKTEYTLPIRYKLE